MDNNPRHHYLYELLVWTGRRSGAGGYPSTCLSENNIYFLLCFCTGTSAKVSFILSGEHDETEARLLWDEKRKVLQRNGVDSFVVAVPAPLGPLTHLRFAILSN